jgi:hypothetical protein
VLAVRKSRGHFEPVDYCRVGKGRQETLTLLRTHRAQLHFCLRQESHQEKSASTGIESASHSHTSLCGACGLASKL